MADFTIILGNKNYSSWSLRAWLMLEACGAAYDEVVRSGRARPDLLRLGSGIYASNECSKVCHFLLHVCRVDQTISS